MANIIFRGGTVPTSANAAIGVAPTAKGLPLTNDEIDKNLFALNLGPTIGTTTISPGATSLTLAGLTSVTATNFIGTASNVTTNANLTGGVTSVGNATTVVTNANLTGGVTSVGNATTVITNANLTGGVTSVGNATTVVTNANLTGAVTSVGNATTLATVNSNVGSFGSATAIPVITVNAKGLVTAASTSAITVGDGALTITTKTAGATSTDVTLELSGAYSANTSTATTIKAVVGPALTNLATLMTTAGAGFIRRGATADTYSIDTNTYLTSYIESDTLASVTGRGFITRASSTAFATTGQGNPGLEVYGAGGVEPSYLTFHRPGVYAIKLGLDGNDLKVGGWSMGAVAYKVWHEGNLTNLNQLTNGPGYTATRLSARNTDDTFVSGDISFIGGGVTTVTRVGNAFTVSSTDTNTVTKLRGTGAGTYQSGDLTLLAGTNVSISQSGTDYTINSSFTDTNTITTIGVNGGAGVSGAVNFNNGTNITISRSGQNVTIASYTELPIKNDAGSLQFYANGGTNATDGIRFAASGAASVSFDAVYSKVTFSSTNTTYTASTGLTLSGTAFSVNYGATSTTACVGNDSRLSDARAASDVYSWAKASVKPSYTYSEIGSTPTMTSVGVTADHSTGTITLAGGGGTTVSKSGTTITITSATTPGIATNANNIYVTQTDNTTNYDYSLLLTAGVAQYISLRADTAGGPTYNPLRNALSLDGSGSHVWAYPALQLGRDWSISQDASSYNFTTGCKATSGSAWTGTGNYSKAMRFAMDPNAGTFYWYVKATDTVDTTTTISFRTAMSLDISGNLTTFGDITAFSDARIKTNVTKIDNALDKVQQLNGYTYDRTDMEGPRQTGVIAQEVIKVLPEAVLGSEDTTYSVAYGNMMGLMIEAIKELNAKVTDLQNQLAINK